MLYAIWLVALGSLVPTLIALLAGKALAGSGAIFPVLPGVKILFFATTWIFVSAVAIGAYLVVGLTSLDEGTQTTIAGFLMPMITGAIYVRNRLK
jgi:hypothetical protein